MSLIFNDKERVGDWVAARVEQTASWGSFYAMGIEQNGELVAGIVINNFNGANATSHIAVAKPTRELPELIRHTCLYAFKQCGLKRLTGMVPASKQKVLAFDKHLGFEEEFVMPCAAADGGALIFLVMWPDKCRWLGDMK